MKRSLVLLGLAGAATLGVPAADATPTYARQTGLPCSACHTQFPELNAFGRQFKLDGYTMVTTATMEDKAADSTRNFLLSLVAPLSVSLRNSYTETRLAEPGKANGTAVVPDMLSVYTGGEITPNVGVFLEIGYDPVANTFAATMLDLRYATHGTLFGKPTTFGLTLNNQPTTQDVWNSTPVWGFPYGFSAVAPSPTAVPVVASAMGMVGLTALGYWNNAVYGEVGLYHAAQLGSSLPLDSTAMGVLKGVAPYWRVALTRDVGAGNLMIGTYGLSTDIYPTGVTGPANRFRDVAVDAQYQADWGANSLTVLGSWIHEGQSWVAGGAANATNTLNTLRLGAIYHVGQLLGVGVSPFWATGTADTVLYSPGAVGGSRTGSPDSQGLIGELDFNPWENLRVECQYITYGKFNGAGSNYDGSGRNASANNTLYVALWLLY